MSGIYRISDDKGPAARGARAAKSTEESTSAIVSRSIWPRVDLLQSGLGCRQANYLLSHRICIKSLSSHYSLLLHASSILLAQLENNVAEVFTPPNASVSPESRVLSSLVLVLSCLLFLLCYSCFLSLLLPIRQALHSQPLPGAQVEAQSARDGMPE